MCSLLFNYGPVCVNQGGLTLCLLGQVFSHSINPTITVYIQFQMIFLDAILITGKNSARWTNLLMTVLHCLAFKLFQFLVMSNQPLNRLLHSVKKASSMQLFFCVCQKAPIKMMSDSTVENQCENLWFYYHILTKKISTL